MHRLAPLYLALPKLVPRLLKELLRAWSVGGSKETCLLAFAGIRQLAAEMPPPFIDTCLKGTYLAFAQACAPRPAPDLHPSRFLRPCTPCPPLHQAEVTTFALGTDLEEDYAVSGLETP